MQRTISAHYLHYPTPNSCLSSGMSKRHRPRPTKELSQVSHSRVIEEGVVLEFTIETQSNNLTYHQPYSKRQQIIFNLIEYLHEDKDWGYRVIAKKMNSWGIKTQRGKTWSNGSVHSVLKRMHQRDVRIENIRNKKFPIDISSLSFRKNFY